MAVSDEEKKEAAWRLKQARLSLMAKHPFYGALLMKLRFALDETCETVYTDGVRIGFSPEFLTGLSEEDLEFFLMHEVLHVVLGHPFRRQKQIKDLELFDYACDIVVNSNILYSLYGPGYCYNGFPDLWVGGKRLPHITPENKEGYLYTAEEVYALLKESTVTSVRCKQQSDETDEPDTAASDDGNGDTDEENTDEENDDKGQGKGKETKSKEGSVGGSFRRLEKDEDVSEEDLADLINRLRRGNTAPPKVEDADPFESPEESELTGAVDDHSFWGGDTDDHIMQDTWNANAMAISQMLAVAAAFGGKGCGSMPAGVERQLEKLRKSVLDWRTILNEFVQEEINDYSFSPPDKRMDDCPFFLPDFNEKDETVKNILFMIDTSASMSDEEIRDCYSEVYGAILQFGGRLEGMLGFFDADVVPPVPFVDESEFKAIRMFGGGGTSFEAIFKYVQQKMADQPLESIIILTDGGAPFPDERETRGIPVLWVINNDEVEPPWGKVARITRKL